MNAHTEILAEATTARAVALHYEDEPTAQDVQDDLQETPLGLDVLALLERCDRIRDGHDKRLGNAIENLRKRAFRSSPEERLAEVLMELLGSPEDVVVVRELAERIAG